MRQVPTFTKLPRCKEIVHLGSFVYDIPGRVQMECAFNGRYNREEKEVLIWHRKPSR